MNGNQIRNLLVYSEIVEGQLNSAREAKVWVAALALGCSLIECLLLMRAISSIQRIQEMPKYQGVTIERLCSNRWGLLELSKLALDLGWFDAKHIDKPLRDTLMVEIRKQVPEDKQSNRKLERALPVLMLSLVRIQRNMIHPGKVATLDAAPGRDGFIEEAEARCSLLEILLRCLRETQNDMVLA